MVGTQAMRTDFLRHKCIMKVIQKGCYDEGFIPTHQC